MKTDYWGVAERKLREYTNPWFASVRRMKLNRADFTVISNNCWAECSDQDIRAFDALDFPNKLCFITHPMEDVQCGIPFPSPSDDEILNDTDRFHHGFNLIEWLNSDPAVYTLSDGKA